MPTFLPVPLYNSVLSLFLSQDVLLICCTTDWISQNHVLASCRMVLRSQNILGLNRAPCLAVFLERLPLLLQEQYSYERVITENSFVFVLFCGPQLRHDFEFFLLKSRAMWQPVTS